MTSNRIVAVALLTQENLNVFGKCLSKVFPVDDTPSFGELIAALEEAHRADQGERPRR